MRKALVFVLAVVLVMGMAVPAYAVGSPAASKEDLKPVLVSTTSEEYTVYTTADVAELSKEEQEVFVEAQKALDEAVPEGMAVRYFFYFDTDEECSVVFQIEDFSELVIMQFVDGEWVELEYTINADGTVTVDGVVAGPMAVIVK